MSQYSAARTEEDERRWLQVEQEPPLDLDKATWARLHRELDEAMAVEVPQGFPGSAYSAMKRRVLGMTTSESPSGPIYDGDEEWPWSSLLQARCQLRAEDLESSEGDPTSAVA